MLIKLLKMKMLCCKSLINPLINQKIKNTYPLFLVFFSTGNIKRLLAWIKDNLLKERPELFVQGESVYESLSIVNEILHVKCLPGLI